MIYSLLMWKSSANETLKVMLCGILFFIHQFLIHQLKLKCYTFYREPKPSNANILRLTLEP